MKRKRILPNIQEFFDKKENVIEEGNFLQGHKNNILKHSYYNLNILEEHLSKVSINDQKGRIHQNKLCIYFHLEYKTGNFYPKQNR